LGRNKMGMKTLLLPFGAFQLNGKFSVELFRDSFNGSYPNFWCNSTHRVEM
jgi:hypothetical protein